MLGFIFLYSNCLMPKVHENPFTSSVKYENWTQLSPKNFILFLPIFQYETAK